jgi:hypothetical protein
VFLSTNALWANHARPALYRKVQGGLSFYKNIFPQFAPGGSRLYTDGMKSSFDISLGVWIAVVPFLGVPSDWRNTLVTLSGLFLALVAAGPDILKRLQGKPKSKPRKKAELKFSDKPTFVSSDPLDTTAQSTPTMTSDNQEQNSQV